MSLAVISRGTWLCGKYGSGDADRSGQFPSGSGSSIPSHMRRVEPLRPAWASWSAIRAPVWRWTKSTIRRQASTCSGLYMPVQPGLMRPSRLTSVISAMTRPAPPTARLPRCTRCQSFGVPSSAEYWHIGETTMRFGEHQLAQPERREHRRRNARGRTGERHAALLGGLLGEPPVHRRDEPGIADLEVLVGDAQAARQQAERELDGLAGDGSARCPRTTRGSPGPRAGGSRPRAAAPPRRPRAPPGRPAWRPSARPARWRPPWRAWSPSRSRSARCGRRRPPGPRCRATSARSGPSGSSARASGS